MQVFDVSGSHYDIGLQIGQKFKTSIQQGLKEDLLLQELYFPFHRTEEGQSLYKRLLALHKRHYLDYAQEIEGMADGAGIPFDELFVANLAREYRGYLSGGHKAVEFGCSTCAYVSDQGIVLGHNEDGISFNKGKMYLVRVSVDHKPSFIALCYPGTIPGNAFGFNEYGVFFSCNNVLPDHIKEGIGRTFISRSMLEAKTMEDAVACASVEPRANGFHYTVGSLDGSILQSVEMSPDQVFVKDITDTYFHANHYINLVDVPQKISSSSKERQTRGEEIRDAIKSAEDIFEVLRDQKNSEYPIAMDGTDEEKGLTLVMALFDTSRRKVCLYPAGNQEADFSIPLLEFSMDFQIRD